MESDSSLTDPPSELESPRFLSLPFRYPSPNSSQDQDAGDDATSSKKRKQNGSEQDAPTKKRKRPEPKPRTTERLDLTGGIQRSQKEQESQLDLLLKVLRKRRKIVVVAGAGISVSAGIPDFRSSNGLFKTLKSEHKLKASGKQLFDASVYQNDKSTGAFHDMVRNLSGLVSTAEATPFHQMLSTLGQEGRLMRLYTQNVDGIDVALTALETSVPLNQKGPWPRSVQLHGGLEKMVCSKCHALSDFEPELFDGPVPPACPKCIEADKIRTDHAGKRSHGVGRLRPRMVLYNEHNPDEEAIGACMGSDLRARPDAIIVVGTSMKIPGVRRIVKEMCGVVRSRRDGITVWINHDEPPPGLYFEDCWDLIVKGPCDEVARQWNMSVNPHMEVSSSEVERARDETNVEVVVKSLHKSKTLDMLTPAPSPLPKPPSKLKLYMNPSAEDGSKATSKTASTTKGKPAKAKPGRKGTSAPPAAPKRQKKPTTATAMRPNATIKSANFPVTKPGRGLRKPSKLLGPSLPLKPTSPMEARNNGPQPQRLPGPMELFPDLPSPTNTGGSSRQENFKLEPQDSSLDLSFNSTYETIPLSDGEGGYHNRVLHKHRLHTPDGACRTGSTLGAHRETVSPPSVPRGMGDLID